MTDNRLESLQQSLYHAKRIIQIHEANIRQHESLFELLPDAVIIMNRDLTIVRANKAAQLTFGEDGSSIVGSNFADCFHSSDLQGVLTHMENQECMNESDAAMLLPNNTEAGFELRRKRGSTDEQIFCCRAWSLFSQDSAPGKSFCLSLQDITSMIARTKEQQRVADELFHAGLLQRSLALHSLRDSDEYTVRSFYNACVQMGGDWLHVEQVGRRMRIGIGDVTGHGYTAALLSSAVAGIQSGVDFALTAMGTAVDEFKRMELIARSIDARIKRAPEHGLAMSLSLATIDLDSGEMWLGNFGHPHPWHVKNRQAVASERDARKILAFGPLLGLMSNDPTQAILPSTFVKAQLSRGDRLFFFSDGLLENHGEECEDVITQRQVKKLVASPNSAAELDDDMRSVMRLMWCDVQNQDDVCYVIFDFQGNGKDTVESDSASDAA